MADHKLAHLPFELLARIAENLERKDRVRLAASSRALRAASVRWFRGDVVELGAATGPIPPQIITWLCRVQAPVELSLTQANLHVLDSLIAGGARVATVLIKARPTLPAQLRSLPQLSTLVSDGNRLAGGWRNLPRQLERLLLIGCGLKQLPAQLAGLTQLSMLSLGGNDIEGGWQHLPRQLHELEVSGCGLRQVPAQLAALTQLRELQLGSNPIEGGWQHLPQRLQRLNLMHCGWQQVPAQLAGLTQLSRLGLANNPLQGGWQHLPRQLRQLELWACFLQQVPPELAALTQLRELELWLNTVEGGWQHLPLQLERLRVSDYCVPRASAQLAGRRVRVEGPQHWQSW